MRTRRVHAFSAFLVLMFSFSAGAAAQPSSAQPAERSTPEPAVTWGVELDTSSRYVWHGLPYSDGWVVWPSAWLSTKGFTVGLWTNLDPHYEPKFNEYDASVTYERPIGRLTVAGTLGRYTYREIAGDPGSTSEAILRVGYSLGPGEVFTTHSFDVEKYRGAYYVDVGYAVERELTSTSTLQLDGSISFWKPFAEEYGVPTDGPLGPATLNIAFVQKLTDVVAIRPHVTFVRVLDRTARREVGTPRVTYGVAIVIGR